VKKILVVLATIALLSAGSYVLACGGPGGYGGYGGHGGYGTYGGGGYGYGCW
jgi:hypothetical protein